MEVESLVESLQQKFISPRTRFGQERIASCEDIFLKKDKNNPAYKVILMGAMSSGKTSLVSRWTRNEFKE
jgi:GTPase SAR1 family protein